MADLKSELEKVAKELNLASDQHKVYFAQIEEALNSLNLGLEAWISLGYEVPLKAGNKTIPLYFGYCRIDKKWGLAFCAGFDHEDRQYWTFNSAPRKYRFMVGEAQMSELLKAMTKAAEEMTSKIEQAVERANVFLKEFLGD